jgi:hypothetical protein
VPAQEFHFGMTLSGAASDNAMITSVFRSVLVQVGLGGAAADRLLDQLLAAANASPAGACTLRFAVHGGEFEIALSQAGRDWRTSCPVPIT